MSKKYTFEEMAKLIAKEVRKATEGLEKAEVVFEERFGNKGDNSVGSIFILAENIKNEFVENMQKSSDYEPKVGDLGYFWDDDSECAIFGILSNIVHDGYRYVWAGFTHYQNFSKEPPMHLFEKKEEVKKIGYESITNWESVDYKLNEIEDESINFYIKILSIVKTINNLDPNKSDNNIDYYEIYPSKVDELRVGWCSVKKPTSFYTPEAAEHALRHFVDIWRGFYGLKRENEE